MKILTVVGARPQFIKAAVVSRVLSSRVDAIEAILHTGQHYDSKMSAVFFGELDIPEPTYNLGIGGGTHGQNTGRMIEGIEQVIFREKPDWVLVYGDTDSTLAGALAAAKVHIPVAHVEAGLRSFNRGMPEEINRVATDHISDLLFAPTPIAVRNLLSEGLSPERTKLVGDVMCDAALYYGELAKKHSGVLKLLGLTKGSYVLATVHRAENTDDDTRLRAIIEGLALVAKTLPVVLPLHPRTRARLQALGLLNTAENIIHFIEPVGYLDMVLLEQNAALIATDSGGVQKEAYFHRVPCVTLREETEWVELLDSGWNRLAPPLSGVVIAETVLNAVGSRGEDVSLYGSGGAAERIVGELLGE